MIPITRLLIVDDSSIMRSVLRAVITAMPGIAVVGEAADAEQAREAIEMLVPDVMTLDIDMPGMDGLTFLEQIMQVRPLPVIMLSSPTVASTELTLRALELGAVDFVLKPIVSNPSDFGAFADLLYEKVQAARRARMRTPAGESRNGLILIGASTGGAEALRTILAALPATLSPVVVTQHMPKLFTRSFAERMDRSSALRVHEAAHLDALLPGHAYIAPGDMHLRVAGRPGEYRAVLDEGPRVNRHRPSVDVLFESAAKVASSDAVGILLTGMGADGAKGLLALRRAGAHTVAQDEESSMVFGMPKAAIDLGAACEIVPLELIAQRIVATMRRQRERRG